jgi:hypothetical protein
MNRNAANAMSLDWDAVHTGHPINRQKDLHDSKEDEYVLLVESANAADINLSMV